jgi:hypothetical protein
VNHENFSFGRKAIGTLHHLALVFIIGREEGFAFLKREFAVCGNGSWWT